MKKKFFKKSTAQGSRNQSENYTINLFTEGENANWEKENTHTCSITGRTYVGYGNNAYPFKGRCSDGANRIYVIPARLSGVTPEMIKNYGGNRAFAKYMDKCLGR